ncbi:MAG: SGNH/GDSL hydrolase family protein [Lachnospiraceae bacterium]
MKKIIKKKLTALLCIFCLLTVCLTGCGKGSDNSSTSNPTPVQNADGTGDGGTSAAVNKYPDAPKKELNYIYHQDMSIIERSLLNTGNTERLQNVLNKAASGEEITVAYIGGSITYGYTVQPDECYAYLFTKWLETNFETSVNYVNAGISGTPSVLGNLRVERDVLTYNPDLVLVEFAVNDGYEDEYRNSYESLITKILSYETEPAVMLLFCITDQGHTCQPWMQEVGEYYDLPMVSVVNSMNAEVEAGNITFADYSKDGSHPTPQGHNWITDYLVYCADTIYNLDFETEHYTLPEKAFYKNYYKDMTLYTGLTLPIEEFGSWSNGSGIADFPDGWTYNPGTDNKPLSFNAKCRGIIILYRQMPSSNTQYGAVDVYIDGQYTKSIYACDSSGWNNPTYNITFETVSSSEHKIEIKAKEGYEDLKFEILGIAYM